MNLTLEQAGIYYRAITMINHQLRENRFDGHAYNRRGACYEQLGNYEYALGDFSLAIEYEPWPHHYTDRARLYLAMGEYEKCIADCEMANERARALCERHGTPYQPFSVALMLNAEAMGYTTQVNKVGIIAPGLSSSQSEQSGSVRPMSAQA